MSRVQKALPIIDPNIYLFLIDILLFFFVMILHHIAFLLFLHLQTLLEILKFKHGDFIVVFK
ncbi:hypothetical protein D3C71_1773750 [compost metagenome]